jgi:hypothetical protein
MPSNIHLNQHPQENSIQPKADMMSAEVHTHADKKEEVLTR